MSSIHWKKVLLSLEKYFLSYGLLKMQPTPTCIKWAGLINDIIGWVPCVYIAVDHRYFSWTAVRIYNSTIEFNKNLPAIGKCNTYSARLDEESKRNKDEPFWILTVSGLLATWKRFLTRLVRKCQLLQLFSDATTCTCKCSTVIKSIV